MKKKKVYVLAALVVMAVTVLNVKTVLEANRAYDVAMMSIDALSESDDAGNGEQSTDQESNNHGSGKFFYEHLQGSPKYCTLYRNVHANGTIVYTDKKGELSGDWVSSEVEGLKERCPDKGSGCTAYSCQVTN